MFPGFVTKQKTATTAVASIEDVLDCTARADALVSALLCGIMAQRRAAGTALDYVKALSRKVAGNCWSMSEQAGHEGPHRMQALLRRIRVLQGSAPEADVRSFCLPSSAACDD